MVELLVTIAIITILAGMTLAALQGARQTAREDKTRATIVKINHYVMEMYESYRMRRLPVPISGPTAVDTARRRLDALRDLMRMEMPERWFDVERVQYVDPSNPQIRRGVPFPFTWGQIPRPVLSSAYLRRYQQARTAVQNKYGTGYQFGQGDERLHRYASAECLYMIVTMGDPDSREHFNDTEIGDTDDDGLPEFLDGWGNPILFLRWAPGFTDTDVQPVVNPPDNAAARQQACATSPDPFNPRKVTPALASEPGWGLVPLIYSAGRDGIYDIVDDPEDPDLTITTSYSFCGNPYRVFTDPSPVPPNTQPKFMMGTPRDRDNKSKTAKGTANGSLDHQDNIHNHRMQVQ